MKETVNDQFTGWLEALEQRHLADLRVSDVTRALRALSVDYVRRRGRVAGDALDGRGKRAAFALFYAPLHFLVVRDVALALGLDRRNITSVVDLGCGSGAAGAALASVISPRPRVTGIDRQGWTLQEAAFTYRHFSLQHRVVRANVTRSKVRAAPETLVVAAYILNELDDASRLDLLESVQALLRNSVPVLVVEPIARSITPWWAEWRSALEPFGVRDDDWRFSEPLPEPLRRWDRAAGLDHRERKARSLWLSDRTEV